MARSDAQPCVQCGVLGAHAEERDWLLPLTFDHAWLQRLGKSLWATIPPAVGVHLVVLATGGFGVGVAAALSAPVGRLRTVTVAKREFGFVSPEVQTAPGEVAVVVDNSLHSGKSVRAALDDLHHRGVEVAAVLTIFDGANGCETLVRKQLQADTGVPVLACASWSDRVDWPRRRHRG